MVCIQMYICMCRLFIYYMIFHYIYTHIFRCLWAHALVLVSWINLLPFFLKCHGLQISRKYKQTWILWLIFFEKFFKSVLFLQFFLKIKIIHVLARGRSAIKGSVTQQELQNDSPSKYKICMIGEQNIN